MCVCVCGLDTWRRRRVCQSVQGNFPLESWRRNHNTPLAIITSKTKAQLLPNYFRDAVLHLTATGIIKKVSFSHLILDHWQRWVGFKNVLDAGEEEWTVLAASTEEIMRICIPPDRDGGMRPRRRRKLSAACRPLRLCLHDALLISLHFRAYQSARPPLPTVPSFLPSFIAVSKSLFLLQQIFFFILVPAPKLCRER